MIWVHYDVMNYDVIVMETGVCRQHYYMNNLLINVCIKNTYMSDM